MHTLAALHLFTIVNRVACASLMGYLGASLYCINDGVATDVGCATGKLLNKIDKLYDNIMLYGIDISEDMLSAIRRKRFKNPIKVYNCGLNEFENNEKYDIIILKQVLHHMIDPKQALIKLSKIINDNGRVIIMTPNERYQKTIIPFDENCDKLGRISIENMNKYLQDVPMEIKEVKCVRSSAVFNSEYDYFNFIFSIGSLQKIFEYKKTYIPCKKFIDSFKDLFMKNREITVDFDYSYFKKKQRY